MIAGSDSPEHRDSETLAASIMPVVPTGSMRMPVALPVPALRLLPVGLRLRLGPNSSPSGQSLIEAT